MKTVRGIYAEAKIFMDDVEEYAEAQVKMICGSQVVEGSKICLMPDIHEKEAYTQDVQTVQDYAELNRQIIAREILKGMKWKASEQFSVAHNYLDASGMLRKGAIAAEKGARVIIPANLIAAGTAKPWQSDIYDKKFRISATGDTCYSFYECKDHTPDRTKGEAIMPDNFIRRMLQAVIESFPIDETKKADILRSIVGQEKTKEDQ